MKRSASSPFYKPAKKARVAPKQATSVARTVRATIRRMATKNSLISTVVEAAVNTNAPGAVGNFQDCSVIIDGVRPSDRSTATVSLQKLRCRGHIIGQGAAAHPALVRLVVGYVKNQAALGPDFPLFESAVGGTASRSFNDIGQSSMLITHPLNTRDFTMLAERVVTIGTSAADGKNIYSYDFTLPLKGRKIHFEGNTEGAGNQDINLVIGVWAADPSNDLNATPLEWSGCHQLWFTDRV